MSRKCMSVELRAHRLLHNPGNYFEWDKNILEIASLRKSPYV